MAKTLPRKYLHNGMGEAVKLGCVCDKELFELFEKANDILGFRITDIMFAGTDDELKQTKVTQPAVFLHSVIMAKALGVKPDAAAGHSLGEFSALVVAGALSFEDGLKLVSKRAMAMQAACEAQPGTMAAILGLEDHVVEEICASVNGIVVAANYNCPGQLVIAGAVEAVDAACEKAKAAGARRALRLPVGGAFHSPLMEPAKQELEKAIAEAPFQTPVCPVYQNVDAKPYTDPAAIKANLIAQLTAPVRWTYIVKNMLADGVTAGDVSVSLELPERYVLGTSPEVYAVYTVNGGDKQESTSARVPAVLTGLDALLEANAGRELDTASDVKPARTAGMLIAISLACTAAAAGATLCVMRVMRLRKTKNRAKAAKSFSIYNKITKNDKTKQRGK